METVAFGPKGHLAPGARLGRTPGEAKVQSGEPAPETEPDPRVFDEVGDVLFTVVNVARRLNVDPELALRATTGRFVRRVERARELAAAAGEEGIPVVEGGTVVVIEGPRFSTRAESRWFAESGFDVVNMTQYPEAWLARELGLCYATMALVTDYDVGLAGMPNLPPVSADTAFRVFAENLDRLRALLFRAVPKIGPQPDDICASALDSAIVHH